MEFQFCGAAGSVTGSKHYVACNEFQFLVDCGLVQERKNLFQNWEPVLENPSQLDAVFLTHAHLDHCGLLPKLVADGFQGKIYGTPATLELAKLVLFDSAHIQEEDAAFKRKDTQKRARSAETGKTALHTSRRRKDCPALLLRSLFGNDESCSGSKLFIERRAYSRFCFHRSHFD